MNLAVPGSASIAVFGATSAPRHCRNFRRSVSMMGPSGCASVTPGLRGANIGFRSCNFLDHLAGPFRRALELKR
jgi:hypothetical protein